MKATKFLIPFSIFLGLLFVLIINSCNKSEKIENSEDFIEEYNKKNRINEHADRNISDPIWLPKGTRTIINGNTLNFTVPNGWVYIIKEEDENGAILPARIASGASGSVTCTCSEANPGEDLGGCHPFVDSQGNLGCIITSPCVTCSRSTGTIIGRDILKIIEGGFVNFEKGINFMKKGEDLPLAFPAMAEIESINNSMNQFVEEIYGISQIPEAILHPETNEVYAPDGYKFVMINVYGRAAAVIFPEDFVATLSNAVISDKIQCECLAEGNCEPAKVVFWMCRSFECPSCKLTVIGIVRGNSPGIPNGFKRFRL